MTTHHIDPERAAFEAFKALPRDTEIHMLNLIRLRERAAYPDGREATGAEAYAAYGRESGPIFRRLGGRQLWVAKPEITLIGPAEEAWDIAFVAVYPNSGAFLAMVTDPGYREAVKHRQAAVADSRLIRMAARNAGAGFGEAD